MPPINQSELNMGDAHLAVEICRQHRFGTLSGMPETGVEVGCYRGATSAKFLQAFPSLLLYMVDSYQGDLPDSDPYRVSGDSVARLTQAEQDENRAVAERATMFGGMGQRRTLLKLPSVEAEKRLGGRWFDFVFLDASHTYESVREDTAIWWPRIKGPSQSSSPSAAGGLMIWHDYGHPRNDRGLFGVRKAVDEFAAENGLLLRTVGSLAWAEKK